MIKISKLFLGLSLIGASLAEAVLELTPDNFDDVVLKSSTPSLVEFFAPWCGHCKNLAPIYEELAQSFQHAKGKVNIAKVDADAHRDLGQRFGVQGFPTLKWFDGKSETPEDYKNGRDLDSLAAFVTDKTGLKLKSNKAPSQVQMLNDKKFNETVGGSSNALVAFTAPWCGRK
jgi:protein disulfide-isomerase A6